MRRRRDAGLAGIPTELRSFRPEQWDPEYVVARGLWLRARKAFADANPDAWGGDIIAVLGPGANLRARHAGRRVPYPDLDEGRAR